MTTEPTNPTMDIALRVAKEARNRLLIPFLMKTAIKKLPFLAMPIINPVFGLVLPLLVDIFYDEGVMLTFFGITTFQVWQEKKEYKEAVTVLAEQLNQPNKELTSEEIKKASDEFDKKLAALIHFNH